MTDFSQLVCTECGDPQWVCCNPGHMAESGTLESGVYVLHPVPEVPPLALCLKCWPFLDKKQTGQLDKLSCEQRGCFSVERNLSDKT
jgi:hypothetical protein